MSYFKIALFAKQNCFEFVSFFKSSRPEEAWKTLILVNGNTIIRTQIFWHLFSIFRAVWITRVLSLVDQLTGRTDFSKYFIYHSFRKIGLTFSLRFVPILCFSKGWNLLLFFIKIGDNFTQTYLIKQTYIFPITP